MLSGFADVLCVGVVWFVVVYVGLLDLILGFGIGLLVAWFFYLLGLITLGLYVWMFAVGLLVWIDCLLLGSLVYLLLCVGLFAICVCFCCDCVCC